MGIPYILEQQLVTQNREDIYVVPNGVYRLSEISTLVLIGSVGSYVLPHRQMEAAANQKCSVDPKGLRDGLGELIKTEDRNSDNLQVPRNKYKSQNYIGSDQVPVMFVPLQLFAPLKVRPSPSFLCRVPYNSLSSILR